MPAHGAPPTIAAVPHVSTPLRRDLRAMSADGAAFSVMVGTGESYFAAFAIAVGLGEIFAGMLATLPMLVGAVLQLATPLAVSRLGSPKRWVVLCAACQALCFVPLIGAALLGRIAAPPLFAIVVAYWAFGMAGGPAWNHWAGAIVPARLRARYFSVRARLCHLAAFAGLVGAGLLLDAARASDRVLIGFAVLFLVAGVARTISTLFLSRQREPESVRGEDAHDPPRAALGALRRGPAGRLVLYLVLMQSVVQISGPYFTPYMLGPLDLPYVGYMGLMAASYAAKIMMMPLLGILAGRIGPARVLLIGGFGIVPMAALWTISESWALLFAVQVLSGSLWAAHELGATLMFFETLDDRERTSVLTLYNLLNASAIALGAVAGAALFRLVGGGGEGYRVLFLVSSGLRLCVAPLLLALASMPVTPRRIVLRTLAIRPAMGSIERPIVATMRVVREVRTRGRRAVRARRGDGRIMRP